MPNTQQPSEDRDLKAYIYQQLAELQPYLIADSQMAVSVHQVSGIQEIDPSKMTDDEIMELELESSNIEEQDEKDILQPEIGDYVVKLTTTLEDGKLEAQGCGSDVFDAFCVAKNEMVAQLSQLQNALLDLGDREVEIQNCLNGSKTIH